MGEKLKVRIEFGEAKADFEGDVDEVIELTMKFLTQICPGLEVLQRIIYTPDVISLARGVEGLVEITQDGPILPPDLDVPARDAICLALLGAYLGKALGKLPRDSLSTRDLARIIGKARKTVSNEVPRLISDGLIERTTDGEYRLTTLGIRRTESLIGEYWK
ncbi:MAG: hypothetical protein AYL33_000770 [Candidatus Bathyarchaeota archaeon B63]|nr:MAG: hypothetical protein AYL33_000770 [Candidatus Bathyarchaeota archaeon B63]